MSNETNKQTGEILIVDDVLENLSLLTEIFRDEGYHIRALTTGKEALSSTQAAPPDLILLDINLPDISGFDVCREVKNDPRTHEIPVIFLSARNDVEDKITGFAVGGVDYITKPFNAKEVTVRARTHINIRKMNSRIEGYVKDINMANHRLLLEIDDRKAAETKAAHERERLSVTLQGIGDAVITTDTSGNVEIMNPIASELTGWSKADAHGKPITTVFNIINEISRKPCDNPVKRVLKTEKIIELENHTLLISRNGKEYVIADSGAPIRDKNNVVIGVVLVFRDITEKQKLTENMQRTDKLESLGVIAGGIAHDFNNLLSGIFGYIELARRDTSDDTPVSSYLDNALSVFTRAKDLTRQLITFSKGGAPIKKTGDLNKLVRKSVLFSISGSNISCEYLVPNDLWHCNFDENQIAQAIGNIAINAKQAMPKGGNLCIKGENLVLTEGDIHSLPPGKYVKLSISDTGKGIPQTVIKRIFDPFYTTKEAGTGLGLAITYSIITKHGGDIFIESAEGKGSVFHIYLPASEEEACSDTAQISYTHKGIGKILLLDDKHFILDILETRLKMMGYSVIMAKDGKEALAAVEAAEKEGEPVKAAIFDLTIPGGMGGNDIIRELRKKYPDMPIFATSGYSEDPVMSDPEKFGFTASLSKPYSTDSLSNLLEKHMNKG